MNKSKMSKQRKIGGLSPIAADVHLELIHLTDKLARLYKLNNGKTALYWHLVTIINSHVQTESFKKMDKGFDGG